MHHKERTQVSKDGVPPKDDIGEGERAVVQQKAPLSPDWQTEEERFSDPDKVEDG